MATGPAWAAPSLPFGPGERIGLRISYLRLPAGRATLDVLPERHDGRDVLGYRVQAKSEGWLSWLLRFRVDDRTVAKWDPETGCSVSVEKKLREGRATRDQLVLFDPDGWARVEDPKIPEDEFRVGPCVLDVLSALYVLRARGVAPGETASVPIFDNGKRYRLAFRFRGREVLDLPAPLGRRVPTVIVEPLLAEGDGLFVRKGRLRLWLTDDARRVPVRVRARAPVGSVAADLESYRPPAAPAALDVSTLGSPE